MSEMMDAVISGDTHKQAEVQARMDKKAAEYKVQEYKWLRENLSPLVFKIFTKIDSSYKRNNGACSTANFNGSYYRYQWATGVDKEFRNYGKSDVNIGFRKGLFYFSLYYCDETGYDQGTHYLKETIKPGNIFRELSKLKSAYKK